MNNTEHIEVNIDPASIALINDEPKSDLTITLVVANGHNENQIEGWHAFSRSGKYAVDLMGGERIRQTKLQSFYTALLSALRSLSIRDKRNTVKGAQILGRPLELVVNSVDIAFLQSFAAFCDNPDSIRDFVSEELIVRISDYFQDLEDDCGLAVRGNRVNIYQPAMKRTYTWAAQTFSVPKRDPRSLHTMPSYFATSDPRVFKWFEPKTAQATQATAATEAAIEVIQ